MELDVDKVYRYVAFSLRKKNYLGVYPDGRVDIKGLTGKKRHVPEFIKEAFLQVIQILSEVISPDEFERARNKIRGIAHQCYERLSKRDFSLAELAFSIMISKPIDRYEKTTPQHVKAAKLLVDAGYEVKPGDVITLIKVKNSLGVKPVQLASIEEVDTKKYMAYMRSTLEQVLDAIGLDFDEILGSTRLESFLWNSDQN
jgi:DNA polymerase I